MTGQPDTCIAGKLAGIAMLRRCVVIAVRAAIFSAAALLVCELILRSLGLQPQSLASVGLSATQADRWTDWSMRPNVHSNEYTVTNYHGLHEDREVSLAKPEGMRRVAVVGSSVVWGPGQLLIDTIPRHAEKELEESGCRAEVLNFSGIGYNLLNASALVQTKVHQFKPDAIVVVMDLQMAWPRWPRYDRMSKDSGGVRRLGPVEVMFKRFTEYSVVGTALDDIAFAQRELTQRLLFPMHPNPQTGKSPTPTPSDPNGWRISSLVRPQVDRLTDWIDRLKAKETLVPMQMRASNPGVPAPKIENAEAEYIARRAQDLSSLIASMSAFSRSKGIPLYFTTPYGPYFRFKPQELPKFSLDMLKEAAQVWGGMDRALPKETVLVSRIIKNTAREYGSRVIDMSDLTLAADLEQGDFSTDGIHFVPQGYRHLGAIVADRLRTDGLCAGRGLQTLLRGEN